MYGGQHLELVCKKLGMSNFLTHQTLWDTNVKNIEIPMMEAAFLLVIGMGNWLIKYSTDGTTLEYPIG